MPGFFLLISLLTALVPFLRLWFPERSSRLRVRLGHGGVGFGGHDSICAFCRFDGSHFFFTRSHHEN